ncbi:MAG: AbrB/MazE/SpoVT family DNA-binding domain-containing protein [Gammaproteobacteria bacterium]|nr:AbrB/MazE/SpoVT family DNA-binding domain-containing protein [Gammaproteobacteria bacterium]
MNAVKISPKYQVVIPKEVRQALRLTPGQNVQVFVYDNRIELIPERQMRDMRGFLKGMDDTLQRENDRL